jgi:hypothetical protein
MIVKIGVTLGPSTREIDKSQEDTATEPGQKVKPSWMQLQDIENSLTRKPEYITEKDM